MVSQRAQVAILAVLSLVLSTRMMAVRTNLAGTLAVLVVAILPLAGAQPAFAVEPPTPPPQGIAPQGPGGASARATPTFRSYTLRNVPAAEAHAQLSQLLSALPEKAELRLDAHGNRLMVNGSEHLHQIVEQFVASVDIAPQGSAPQQLGPSVFKSYPVPAHEQPRVAGDLRVRFPSHLGVRVSPDPRRQQLLVLAPPELHSQIAEFLQSQGAGNAVPAEDLTKPNVSLMNLGRIAGRVVWIESPWQELHARLKEVWGTRLTTQRAVGSDPRDANVPAIYTVRLPDGDGLRLEVAAAAKQITIHGPEKAATSCARLLATLDRPGSEEGQISQVAPLGKAKQATIERAISAVRGFVRPASGFGSGRPWAASEAGRDAADRRGDLVTMLFQPKQNAGDGQPEGEKPPKRKPDGSAPPGKEGEPAIGPLTGALVGEVRVDIIPELGLIIITGRKADVDKVIDLINAIVRDSEKTVPIVEVYPLQHIQSEAAANIVTQIYDAVYSARTGTVRITPLVKPNALLLIGPAESVKTAMDLIKRLDEPASPDAQFQVFRLKHVSAQVMQTTLQRFYGADPGPRPVVEQQQLREQLPGLFPRIHVIADFRSNSLIVRGAPRDLVEVAKVISELDRPETAAQLDFRIFPLRNSLAGELAQVLQSAINASQPGQVGQQQQQIQIPGVTQQQQPGAGAAGQQAERRSTALRLMTLDAKKKQILTTGVLTDVQITPDARANALLVKAPESSMDLIAELIRQLDTIPGAEAQVKVFTVINGDAQSLVQMLVALFGQPAGQQGQQQPGVIQFQVPGAPAAQAAPQQQISAQGESVLVPLRFAVDARTNSILATGSPGDLILVETILDYLSQSDAQDRKTQVFRLRNVPADLVSQSINQFLTSERQLVTQVGVVSSFEQMQQEVVVVPEVVTNSLIISATPRFFDEIRQIIENLDRRPPMVMIQVLIAEVALNNTDEFGVELGLQDSVLFDRSLVSNLVTTTTVTQNQAGGQVQQTNLVSALATPGFAFNNNALGNNAFSNSSRLGGQAISHFAVGRMNGDLGYGGLVLSASNESISVLVRALQECRRLDVLSRPQITTLNNQPAFVQVGQRVQLIQSATVDPQTNIQTNQLGPAQNVGLILGVTPRVADDGRVAMEIDVEKSEVGPEAEGIPISVLTTGDVIRSPRINTTTAQTTVSALSGQTIVLGGLITTNKSTAHRRVPLLASVPVLGHLFRYDFESQQKTELLIILTPRVIWDEEDAELVKQVESARMSWVLTDVHKMHGSEGLLSRWDAMNAHDIPMVYPDADPRGMAIEPLPPPADQPQGDKQPSVLKPPGPPPKIVPPGAAPPKTVPPPWLMPQPKTPAPPPYLPGKRGAAEGPVIPQPSAAYPQPMGDPRFQAIQPATYQWPGYGPLPAASPYADGRPWGAMPQTMPNQPQRLPPAP
jgi:general secretion pathway protein D